MNSHGKNAKAVVAATAPIAIISKKTELEARIAALKTSAKDVQHEIHVLAVSTLAFVAKHKNINVLTQFLDAMPEMVRINGLKTWFETFGNVTYDASGEAATWRIDGNKKVRLGDAMVKPFWKFKATEGKAYEPLNMQTFIDTQIKRLEADIKAVPEVVGAIDTRKTLLDAFKAAKAGTVSVQ